MDGERSALERQKAQAAKERAQRDRMKAALMALAVHPVEIPSFTSGGGWLDAPVVLRRVDGRTIQPPVRLGLIERMLRWMAGR